MQTQKPSSSTLSYGARVARTIEDPPSARRIPSAHRQPCARQRRALSSKERRPFFAATAAARFRIEVSPAQTGDSSRTNDNQVHVS